jgi:hypothetical protein
MNCEGTMGHEGIWMSFLETLAAVFTPFGIATHPKARRDASWWPV